MKGTTGLRFLALVSIALASACQRDAGTPLALSRPSVATGPLRVDSRNPRYFVDANGATVYLGGAHTWANLQDATEAYPPAPFDYDAFLDSLARWNHNFFRLWAWEQSKGSADTKNDFYYQPLPYARVGPDTASDGRPRFDLQRFDAAYFDRLRERVRLARDRGFYVSVMLFNGWSVDDKNTGHQNPWLNHPFRRGNNINGVDGDANHDESGLETHTLAQPAITAIQDAYVRHVVDAVNDLDNVLYEVSNESSPGAEEWQYHIIRTIRDYESTKPKQHPIGMTAEWPKGQNDVLSKSPADWISPHENPDSLAPTTGSKVVVHDTDHLCGICGNSALPWKSFLRGGNTLFMDLWDGSYTIEPANDVKDHRWSDVRRNIGYALAVAQHVPLSEMLPKPDQASSGYCLSHSSDKDAEYLVLLEQGRSVEVDLTNAPKQPLIVEWLSLNSGRVTRGDTISGGARQTLRAPISRPAVVYVHSVTAGALDDNRRGAASLDRETP